MRNGLHTEPSRYLQQHAENPVDWHAWGEAAFTKAEEEGKPLLLSIGYSSCHWCHVMAHESFEHDEAARAINDVVIPVKIDREEYPDVDGYYISFVSQLTGQGGWPLNVFVNPRRAPFYGLTYAARERFTELLSYIGAEYTKNQTIREQRINTSFSQKNVGEEELRIQPPTFDPLFPEVAPTPSREEDGGPGLPRGR